MDQCEGDEREQTRGRVGKRGRKQKRGAKVQEGRKGTNRGERRIGKAGYEGHLRDREE